jgi:hypothetical protein
MGRSSRTSSTWVDRAQLSRAEMPLPNSGLQQTPPSLSLRPAQLKPGTLGGRWTCRRLSSSASEAGSPTRRRRDSTSIMNRRGMVHLALGNHRRDLCVLTGLFGEVDDDSGKSLEPLAERLQTTALVAGANRHGWLRELLPQRPTAAVDCSQCGATGRIHVGADPTSSSTVRRAAPLAGHVPRSRGVFLPAQRISVGVCCNL